MCVSRKKLIRDFSYRLNVEISRSVAIGWIVLLAICQEPFMKHNNAFWNLFGKRQGKENFLRNSLVNQFWEILET